ncbi:uncharacterized protein [Blastocystis hominis]|uniref:Uncharacterized protein n=1 Tax=Blastocystis hominis TaxID=12968 RepID=D8LWX8_BLAHO|nr:uncharacterized protein [Blastocystis hominis]CBK20773.2 unnamed protein product [Blastocystis hominis]|eukprot:XP_012894821.1 uncharacterized protein [Blastocystis hominis]
MLKELKTFRLSVWGKWLGYLASLFCLGALFSFGKYSNFFHWIIALVLLLAVVALIWFPCFKCFSSIKNINEKLSAAHNPLIIGVVMLLTCWSFWKPTIIGAILIGIAGLFDIIGSFVDKKGGNDSMV